MRTWYISLLLCLTLPAYGAIYKYKDAQGQTVFSDKKPEGVKSEVVRNRLTILPSAPGASQPIDEPLPLPEDPGPAYQSLSLTGLPEQNGSLRANGGAFSVGVKLQPPLKPGQTLRLLLDGQPYGTSDGSQGFSLSGISRGEHRLQVQVLSGANVVQQGDEQVFTLQRVSLGGAAAP